MRMLMAIVFGCAMVIGVSQAASPGATEGVAPAPAEMTEDSTEDAEPGNETSYECKYSPYCRSASQCVAYCAGGAAVCERGCCACAS